MLYDKFVKKITLRSLIFNLLVNLSCLCKLKKSDNSFITITTIKYS